MTELQIKAAQLREDVRHNLQNERLTEMANRATAEHYKFSDSTQAKHYADSDAYTAAHYQMSDESGRISANANALNAQTAANKYQMEYDIEYGWTGDKGYPKGMPLSAQQKTAEIAREAGVGTPRADVEQEQREAEVQKTKTDTIVNQATVLNKYVSSVASSLNSVFGKGGIISVFNPSSNNSNR